MATKKQLLLARRWDRTHRGALLALGKQTLQDAPGTVFTLDTLTFVAFADNAARCAHWRELCALAKRRKAKCWAQHNIDEHTRRLRRWCREQIVLLPARRRTVMVVAP